MIYHPKWLDSLRSVYSIQRLTSNPSLPDSFVIFALISLLSVVHNYRVCLFRQLDYSLQYDLFLFFFSTCVYITSIIRLQRRNILPGSTLPHIPGIYPFLSVLSWELICLAREWSTSPSYFLFLSPCLIFVATYLMSCTCFF